MAQNGSDTGNWQRDTDLLQSSQSQKKQDEKVAYYTTPIEFISEIERISEIESKSEEKLDAGLFTTKEVLNGFRNGFKVGIIANILIFLHIFIFILLSFSVVTDFLSFEPAPFFLLKYIFAILTIIVTVFIASLSRLAVGSYTNKAIITFFGGKFLSSFMSGILLIFLLGYLRAIVSDHSTAIAEFLNKFAKTPLTEANSEVYYFVNSFPSLYYETIMLVLASSFLPYIFFWLRKYFFKSNRISDYKSY